MAFIRKVLWKLFLLCLLGAAVVFVASGPYLSVSDEPEKADAIVVISGGGNERVKKGVDLYHGEWAPLLIVSGSAFSGSKSNAEIMRDIAMKYDVPGSAIMVEPEADTTYENAFYVKRLLTDRELTEKRVILVTSEYHSRRAQIVFDMVLDSLDIDVLVVSGHTDEWGKWSWWQSKRGWYLTGSEVAKISYMFVTGLLEKADG